MSSSNTQLQLTFENKSALSGSVVLYQKFPNGPESVYSVAWVTKYTHPGTAVNLKWTENYCFVWSETTLLTPGTTCKAYQILPTTVYEDNAVGLTFKDSAYTFVNPQTTTMQGVLQIIQDNTIPLNQALVGIGMSESPTFLANAQPNLILNFNVASEYWIAFGNFTTGDILDLAQLTNTVQISFPFGADSMYAVLNPDNSLTVSE